MSEDKKDTAASPEGKAPEAKPKDYVLIQHLQRFAGSRTLRASRAGHRRQGVVLNDGTRIRRKAYRYTELSIQMLLDNHQSILEHVREGRLAVFNPNNMEEATYEQLVELIQSHLGMGKKVDESSYRDAAQEKASAVIEEVVTAPVIIPEVKSTEITRPDVDTSAVTAAVDQAEAQKKGEANPRPSEREVEDYHAPTSTKKSGKRSKS